MRQHAGVFAANFSSNLLWQNCFAPKKCASCAEPRRVAAGILDVCQGGATMGLRQTRLLRRMFSYARRPKRPAFVCGEGCRSREGQKPLPHGKNGFPRQCVPQGHLLRGAHWLGMTALRAGNGGTHGSRPTGCGGHPGRTGSSAPTRQNRNRAKRDGEDTVPYTLCHCEERSDAAIRSPQPKETDSRASDTITGTE